MIKIARQHQYASFSFFELSLSFSYEYFESGSDRVEGVVVEIAL